MSPENSATDKKGKLYRWTLESAEWYEDASRYTGYHDRLTEILAPYLDLEMTCCELAAGTGTLARHLAPLVKSYTANDIDPSAIAWMQKMLDESPQQNMKIVHGDWKEKLIGQKFSVSIFSFFSAVLDDWEFVKQITTDRVLIVMPRTAGMGRRAKFLQKDINKYEIYPAILEYLEKNDVRFIAKEVDLEFGQPFHDMETARKYVNYYYKFDEKEIDTFLEAKLQKTDFGWYFPKNKDLGIICAYLR